MLEKPKKKKKSDRFSDSYMNKQWRKAVLAFWGHECIFCGRPGDSDLECHHIIRRRKLFTRFLYTNGVPICRIPCRNNWIQLHGGNFGMSGHEFAHTRKGDFMILKIFHRTHPKELKRTLEGETKNFKDELVRLGITEKEFFENILNELKNVKKFYDSEEF